MSEVMAVYRAAGMRLRIAVDDDLMETTGD